MRIIAILSLLLMLVTGCGTKNTETATEPADAPETAQVEKAKKAEPVGTVVLTDGSTVELTGLKQMDNVLIHITGKLNGRTSTLIQMTRVDDIRTWKGITFQAPNAVTIIARNNKEFPFTDATIYIGSKSEDAITFINNAPGADPKEISIPKSSIKLISFTPLKD